MEIASPEPGKNGFYYYRGYRYTVFPVYEDAEERLARGDWRSRIVGYRLGQIEIEEPCRWRKLKGKNWPKFDCLENLQEHIEEAIEVMIDTPYPYLSEDACLEGTRDPEEFGIEEIAGEGDEADLAW